jgi:hypothetical protein
MAILVARQETVGETSTVHFSGECGRCSAKLKWHRKIVADGPPLRFSDRTPCPADCPREMSSGTYRTKMPMAQVERHRHRTSTSPATPAIKMACFEAEAAATPIMRLAVDTIASSEPNTAARSQRNVYFGVTLVVVSGLDPLLNLAR